MHNLSGKLCYDDFFRKTHARLYMVDCLLFLNCMQQELTMRTRRVALLSMLVVSSAWSHPASNALIDSSKEGGGARSKRLFSLFNVVTFQNDDCTATSGSFSGGTLKIRSHYFVKLRKLSLIAYKNTKVKR